MGLMLRQEAEETIVVQVEGAPDALARHVVEGAGLGTAYASCNGLLRKKLLAQVPRSHYVPLWYGFGRADLYCLPDDSLSRPPSLDRAYFRGFEDAWRLDYGAHPDRPVEREWLERLKIY